MLLTLQQQHLGFSDISKKLKGRKKRNKSSVIFKKTIFRQIQLICSQMFQNIIFVQKSAKLKMFHCSTNWMGLDPHIPPFHPHSVKTRTNLVPEMVCDCEFVEHVTPEWVALPTVLVESLSVHKELLVFRHLLSAQLDLGWKLGLDGRVHLRGL